MTPQLFNLVRPRPPAPYWPILAVLHANYPRHFLSSCPPCFPAGVRRCFSEAQTKEGEISFTSCGRQTPRTAGSSEESGGRAVGGVRARDAPSLVQPARLPVRPEENKSRSRLRPPSARVPQGEIPHLQEAQGEIPLLLQEPQVQLPFLLQEPQGEIPSFFQEPQVELPFLLQERQVELHFLQEPTERLSASSVGCKASRKPCFATSSAPASAALDSCDRSPLGRWCCNKVIPAALKHRHCLQHIIHANDSLSLVLSTHCMTS